MAIQKIGSPEGLDQCGLDFGKSSLQDWLASDQDEIVSGVYAVEVGLDRSS